jgi:hypothetical protein
VWHKEHGHSEKHALGMASNLLPLDCGMPAVGLGCAWREEGERGTSEPSFQALTILLHLAPHIRGAFSFTLDMKRELAAAASIVPPGLAISVVMGPFWLRAWPRTCAHPQSRMLGRELLLTLGEGRQGREQPLTLGKDVHAFPQNRRGRSARRRR